MDLSRSLLLVGDDDERVDFKVSVAALGLEK
jgi:hypothetical protein